MKNNQEYVMMAARKNRRFWLAAGTALLVWQVNNQTAQADVQQTPTSSADTTVVTANATAASNVVQLQSGAKTSTKTTPTTESTKTDSTNPQQAGSDSQATSASGTVSSATKTGESGQAASDLTAEADNRAKSVSTTPYTDGDNAVENKQNTTTVTTSADKSATRSQSTTETGTTPAQSVETDKAGSAGDSVPVDSATKADQVNDTSLSNDGYDAVGTDVNSSQPSETDKTGTDQTQSSTDGIDSQTVTDEKTSAGLTADSLSSLQPRLAQVQASSLQLDTVDAAPTVAQDYAAWDAITDTTRKGIMGTSEWWIDDSDNTLHLGAGQLADANVQFDDNTEVTDWGNVGWGQYMDKHTSLTLVLEGNLKLGTNARGLFSGLTVKTESLKSDISNSVWNRVDVSKTRDMSYMFARATTVAVDYNANYASGYFYFENWSLYEVNVAHMFERVSSRSDSAHPTVTDTSFRVSLPGYSTYTDMSYMFNSSDLAVMIFGTASVMDPNKSTSMSHIFNDCKNLTGLGLERLDTESVIDMSYMFNNDINLTGVNMRDWVTDRTRFSTINVTNMSHMFTNCNSMKDLDVSLFKTSSVTNMSHMFDGCHSQTLDVAGFDTAQVADMTAMFNNATKVERLDLSNFDTHLISNMTNMFSQCESLTSLILPINFVTKKVTTMHQMFKNCWALTSLVLPNGFDTSNVTDMDELFSGCKSLISLDLSKLDTSRIVNMSAFFNDCQSLKTLKLSNFTTDLVTTMAEMFNGCQSLVTLDLSMFDTGNVTTMAEMFNGCQSLVTLDLSVFDTGRVTTMARMFNDCSSMETLAFSFNAQNVITTFEMFAGCSSLANFNSASLMNTGNVTNMSGMFKGDRALVSLDISKLATSQVTTMSHMFEDVFAAQKVQSFTGLEKLDTSNVTDMSYMFAGFFLPVAMSLNLVNFDTRKVLNMQGMFKGYVNFKDNYLGYLQTGNVTDMSYMLSGLVNHTQFTWSNNLDTHSVTTMAYMFSDSPDMETFVWKQQLGMNRVTDMQGMFANNIALVNVDFEQFDSSQVTNMQGMFANNIALVNVDFEQFDSSQVTNMQGMFANNIALVNVNFEQFDTSQVTDMTSMFSGDTRLERLDLTSFDTSNVEHMYKMFYLDSALKNLNLSSFSGEKLQFNYVMGWGLFGLFNPPIVWDSDGNQQVGQYQTCPSTLTLGGKTRLSLPKLTSVVDLFDPSQLTEEVIQALLETYPTVEAFNEALVAETGLTTDLLVSAYLAPSQGFDGVWINNATAETLTSEQLMARYDGTNPLATDATWTWQNILGKDLQVISGTNSTWAPKDSLAGLIDTSKTVDDLTTTVTDTTTNQTLTSSQLNALLQQPAHSGQYQVAYQYTDGDGTKQISVPVTLSLVANQSLITAKDSVLQLGTTWTAADNIASLLDADGSVTDLTKVNGVVSVNGIENGTVDTTIPGVYQIDYQITDSTGTVRTATATVIVNGLTLKETQVNVSTDDRWDPMTNITKAIDDQGNEATVELTIMDASDTEVANIKKPGTYQLNYHFTDAHGEHTATAAVNVKADENHADLQVKDSRVYQFGTWTPTDNFVSAMDSDGETLDISALSVTGTVDLNLVGKYTITYQFTDQFGVAHSGQATVEVLENQAAISVDNNSGKLYAHGVWNPDSVVVTATDVDGTTVEAKKIKCSGTVDMTTPGENKLTYSFVDSLGKEHSKDTTVTVLENQAAINVDNNSGTLYANGIWNPASVVVNATDVDGTVVEGSEIKRSGTVDMTTPGEYELTYSFVDSLGKEHSKNTTVTVLENQAAISVDNNSGTLYANGIWNPDSIVITAIDVDGTTVENTKIKCSGTVDVTTPGEYKLTYSFVDSLGKEHSKDTTVTVLENHAAINVDNNSGTLYANGIWNPESVVVNATDVDGTVVEGSEIKRSGTVDMTTPGDYKLTYSFMDSLGKEHSKDTTVTVLENHAAISVDNNSGTLYAHGVWNPASVVVSATDVDGTAVEGARIKCSGTVDMTTPGDYKLTYSFVDSLGKEHSKDTTVTVLENLAAIIVDNNSGTLYAHGVWNPASVVVSATDVDGTAVEAKKIKCIGTVDVTTPGEYKLTYSFVDSLGKEHSKDTMVTVLKNHAAISVDNNSGTLYAHGVWNPASVVVNATDVDGTTVEDARIKCIGTVDMSTPGDYELTYSFVDSLGKEHSKDTTVTVLENHAAIIVDNNSGTLYAHGVWNPASVVVNATDVDGTTVEDARIKCIGTVDMSTPGDYELTYSFKDSLGHEKSTSTTVKVLENHAAINVNNNSGTLYEHGIWNPESVVVNATDVDGTVVEGPEIKRSGTVDMTTPGNYELTYSFVDSLGKEHSENTTVTVLENQAAINVDNNSGALYAHGVWNPASVVVNATDVDGSTVEDARIKCSGTVDMSTPGDYELTYSFKDSLGHEKSTSTTVTVLENQAAINVDNNSGTLYAQGAWNPDSIVITAVDVDGTTVENVRIKRVGTVDMTTPGDYKLTYSFTDSLGREQSTSTAVTVLENQAAINAANNSGKLYAHGVWNPDSVVVNAVDVDGTTVEDARIKRVGTVDTTTPGDYELTYSFKDSLGHEQSTRATVTVLENHAAIEVDNNSGKLYAHGVWNPDSIVITAVDVDGTTVENVRIKRVGTVDTTTPGDYKLTYSFTDSLGHEQSTGTTVTVLENMAGIKVKSTTESFRVGAKWSEKDNFDSATDVDGTPINLSNIDIESTVNSEVAGQYKVTYSFTDQQGKLRSVEVPVEVLANLAGIKAKSTTESFRIGAKWSAKDNFEGATDVDGTPIDLADVDITSTVDPEKVGQYKVTYSFTDQQGQFRKADVTVDVLANLAGIKAKSTTESFRIGAKWSEKDNFDSATDVDGTPIDLADVNITSTVDPEKVGQYNVTYSFTDQQGQLRSIEVPVEVLANLAGIKVKSKTESFRIGAKWSAEDNFDSATDVDGTPIDLADVDVISTVDSKAVGQYKVTYSFTDQQGKLRSVEVPVEVLANLAGIKVKSATESFHIGAKWSAEGNFESATNVDGTVVALSDVDITSTVDPEKVGQYKVTYSFIDQQGQLRKAEVTVDVLANLAGIKVKSTTESFRIGAKWSEKDNFDSATDVDGTPINLADVNITSTVDSTAVGQYKVTYSFTDQQGKLRSLEVPVEVLSNLAGIKVKSTAESFRIGAEWSEKDNFDRATNVDGTPVDLADVDITSTVDSKAVGQYMVTYSFTDQQGTVQQVIVPVNVLANYANLQLNQTELSFRAGDNRWQPESNIAAATDIDGRAIDLATIQITNAVDSTTSGTYLVNYAFTDSFNQTHRATATVTVLDNLAALKMKRQHVTLYLGNRQWQPEDNFGGAKNVDGSAITFDQLQVLGHYDLKVVGDYELTYQFTDQLGHLRTAQFTVTVAENQATIVVEKTAVTLHVGDTWEPMMNFVSATDMDGQALAEDRISVNVTKLNQRLRLMMMRSRTLPIVDTTVAGRYQVSYQFIDGNGNLQELATTVTVLPNESALKLVANDITLYAGDEWQPMANVVKATNVDGTPVTADQLRISGSVNPNVVGQYRVLYSFVDQQNKLQQAVTTVNVLANQAALLLKHDQVALTVGDEWQPLANLQLARDVDGHEIASTDLVIDGQVDTAAPGTYQVRYHFTDMRGHEQQAVAMVTVVEPIIVDQALLRLHAETVTLRAGATWAPLSNVAEVLDSDGSAQTSEQVSVQGTVDLNQAGKYLLTYHFLDQLGHDHSATATIIVLENEASLKLRTTAVTLKVGQKWDATANILAATDVDGRSINEAVVITGDVDWRRPGIYQLTYELVDQLGKMHSAKTKITLIAADDGSDNQGGNGNTDNGSGNQGDNGNTDNGSGNQGGNGNTGNGSGNQGGNGNTDNGSGNQGGNGNTGNGSGNQGGNGNTGNGSGNQGGNGNTDNGSG
ncbi:DUF5011 domain-containing protein, partial [Lactiplantibacillus pentosus]